MDTCVLTPRRVILIVSIVIISITIGVPSTSVSPVDQDPTTTVSNIPPSSSEDDLTSRFEDDLTSSFEDDLAPSFEDDLKPSFEDDMTLSFENDLTLSLAEDLTPSFADDLTSSFADDLTSSLSDDLTSSFTDDLTSSFAEDPTSSFVDDLTSTLSAELTSTLSAHLTSSLPVDLTTSLGEDLTTSVAPTIGSSGGQITTSTQTTPQPDIFEPKDVTNYPVNLKIKTDAKFTEELKNESSQIYGNYSRAFKTVLTELYKGVTGVNNIVINGFSQGSIICNYEVSFNLGNTFKKGVTANSIIEKIQSNLNKTNISNELTGDIDEEYFQDQMDDFSNSDIAKRFSDPCLDACPSKFNCVKSYTAKPIKCCRIGNSDSECMVPDSISLHDKITIIVSSVVGAIGLILIVMISVCVYNRNKHKGSKTDAKIHEDNNYRSSGNSFMNDRNRPDPTKFDKAWSSPGNYEDISEQNARMARGADRRYEKPYSNKYEMVYSPSRREDKGRDDQEIRDPYSHSGEFSIYQPTSSRRGEAMNADLRMQSEMYPDYPYKEKRSSQEFVIRRPTVEF